MTVHRVDLSLLTTRTWYNTGKDQCFRHDRYDVFWLVFTLCLYTPPSFCPVFRRPSSFFVLRSYPRPTGRRYLSLKIEPETSVPQILFTVFIVYYRPFILLCLLVLLTDPNIVIYYYPRIRFFNGSLPYTQSRVPINYIQVYSVKFLSKTTTTKGNLIISFVRSSTTLLSYHIVVLSIKTGYGTEYPYDTLPGVKIGGRTSPHPGSVARDERDGNQGF